MGSSLHIPASLKMKGIVAFVTMAMAFAIVQAGEDPIKTKIAKIFNGCKEKNPLTDAELGAMRGADLSFAYSKSAKCMLSCMLQEGKMLTDGKYNKGNALVMADVLHIDDPDEAAKAKQVVEHCATELAEVGPDLCEFAYNMALCGAKEAVKLGMKKHEFFE